MNSEENGNKEVIDPVTMILPDSDTVDHSSPKQSIILGNNSQVEIGLKKETKQTDHSIMVTQLKEELLNGDDSTKPYQRQLKGKGWIRIKFTLVIIAVMGSFIFVAGLVMSIDEAHE
jgi:hypothetical protein